MMLAQVWPLPQEAPLEQELLAIRSFLQQRVAWQWRWSLGME